MIHDLADMAVERKILILDDIIINGRMVNDVLDELKEIYRENCLNNIAIQVWCIVRNSEAKCIGNISKYFGHYRYVTPDDWKKLSNKLTKL